MYKKILVPLDGSKRAAAILPHATELACLFDAEITFLRVFELHHVSSYHRVADEEYGALPHLPENARQAEVKQAEEYLAQRVAEVSAQGIPARAQVAFGPIAVTIIQTAAEINADLIAMASHGRGGLPGVYYGSVAAGVLQRVDRPLLIVRSVESS